MMSTVWVGCSIFAYLCVLHPDKPACFIDYSNDASPLLCGTFVTYAFQCSIESTRGKASNSCKILHHARLIVTNLWRSNITSENKVSLGSGRLLQINIRAALHHKTQIWSNRQLKYSKPRILRQWSHLDVQLWLTESERPYELCMSI